MWRQKIFQFFQTFLTREISGEEGFEASVCVCAWFKMPGEEGDFKRIRNIWSWRLVRIAFKTTERQMMVSPLFFIILHIIKSSSVSCSKFHEGFCLEVGSYVFSSSTPSLFSLNKHLYTRSDKILQNLFCAWANAGVASEKKAPGKAWTRNQKIGQDETWGVCGGYHVRNY